MTHTSQDNDNMFDKAYKGTEDMFGQPYRELQNYFNKQATKGTILDLGSGQGRDALFLAKLGYNVTAIDTSKVGVEQMLKKAAEQKLRINGMVADILAVQIESKYDVILFDMILHAFKKPQQVELLEKYSNNLKKNGMMCIVFPDDMKTEYFIEILKSLSSRWCLKDEIIIKDTPKMENDDNDYIFTMITVQRVP